MKNAILIVVVSLALNALLVQCHSGSSSFSESNSHSHENGGPPPNFPYISCQNETATCLNGGTCNRQGPRYVCSCTGGYHGPRCLLTACERYNHTGAVVSTCLNGGSCAINATVRPQYTCTCLTGFSGQDCQNESCAASPCQNGANCTNTGHGGSFRCQCSTTSSPQFAGERCNKRYCDKRPCHNNGTCTNFVNGTLGGTCACLDGWSGPKCKLPVCPTTYALCQNGGVCTNTARDGSFKCNCSSTNGFSGMLCDKRACDYNPCRNGGTCVNNTNGTYGSTCTCPAGLGGLTCNVEVCTATRCPANRPVCNNTGRGGSYQCTRS